MFAHGYILGLITRATASFPDWAWACAHGGDCRGVHDECAPGQALRHANTKMSKGAHTLLPFRGIPNVRQNGLDESGWASRVFWSAYSGGISKTKFQVRVSWLSLSAQNGLFVTRQLPWSLRTSVKAVFPPPLCTFFPFCNLVCLFLQRQGKKLSFITHTWTAEVTLSSWWRKITWQYPKSCLWKKGFDTVWLFFFLRAETLFQLQKTLYFLLIFLLLSVLVNKCPDFGTDFSLCLSWQLSGPYSSNPFLMLLWK